jgi:fatty acid desaturase
MSACRLAEFQVPEHHASHPGGQLVLETARMSKCPGLLFLSYHLGCDFSGKVEPAARALGVAIPQQGKMYAEMHAAFRKVRETHPEQHMYFVVYCMMLTGLLPVVWLWWLAEPSIIRSMIVGVVFELYFLNVFHTRHHQGGHIYQNKLLRWLTEPMYEFVESTWGYNPAGWRMNHHVKHHVFTNDSSTDNVLPSFYPLVRSCYDTQLHWFHKFQTFYFPLLIPLSGFSFPIMNILEHNGTAWHFCAWIFLSFILPVWLHGWSCLIQAVVLIGFAGALLSYKFAVSHTHSALTLSTTNDKSYNDIDEWLKVQIEESISYGGHVFSFLFGGINMQIEHHLCPTLDPALYSFVAPDIARICCKYGVKYTAEASFGHAVWQFHRQLWRMGRWEDDDKLCQALIQGAHEVCPKEALGS